MNNKTKQSLIIVGMFIAVIGIGVGGYFLGKYLDTQKLEKQYNLTNTLDTVKEGYEVFVSDKYNYGLTYPTDWEGGDSDTGISFTSPNESIFLFSYIEAGHNFDLTCDNHDCIDGNGFSRYIDETLSDDESDFWVIVEDKYSDKQNYFAYIAFDNNDLEALDNIMSSVQAK